jgi:hypothetical protein
MLQRLRAIKMNQRSDHPSREALAAYAVRAMADLCDGGALEEHLVHCDRCRTAVHEVESMVSSVWTLPPPFEALGLKRPQRSGR